MLTTGRAVMGEMQARKQLARYCRLLYRLGFAPGTAGNLSVRLNEDRILATPTGCSKLMLKPDDMVMIDRLGTKLYGSRQVTSEIGMHLAVYEAREDVGAVVHGHPPTATAFASSGRALDEPLCEEILMSVGPVPLATYGLTGTPALARAIAPLLRKHDSVLLANHGALSYATTLPEAFMHMETVEHFAKVMLAAEQLGTKQLLRPEQVAAIMQAKRRYIRNSECHDSESAQETELASR